MSNTGEIAHCNSSNWELSNDVQLVEVRYFTLTPIEAWRRAVSTTLEGHRVSSEIRLESCRQVLWVCQICSVRLMVEENSTSHLFWLVQTCSNLSTIQWPYTLFAQCHFLHFWMLLFFSITPYPAEIAYFNSPNRELSNVVLLVEVRPRKIALHTSSHLMPIEAWRKAVSTTLEGRGVLSEVPLENCTQVLR